MKNGLKLFNLKFGLITGVNLAAGSIANNLDLFTLLF